VLIDQQGIVRDIAASPLAPPTGSAQVDSTVKSVAGKIPALLTTAVGRPLITSRCAGNGSAVGKSKWRIDVKGRRLERAAGGIAPQMTVNGAGNAQAFVRRK
jgi:hypothetical protein